MFGKKYFYLDNNLTRIPPREFKEAQTAADSNSYIDGDVVEVWDHVFRWNSDCVPFYVWEEWRQMGDDLADAALPVITGPASDQGATDMLSRLEAAANQEKPDVAVSHFWTALHSGPQQKLWPDEEQILRGQAVFYRYAPQILASLLHWSLSSGFSSPRISRILNIASYLVPPMNSTPEGEAPRISKESNDRSFMRLMETTQWLIDCMSPGAMKPRGVGWSNTVRVRILHTMMRRRILEKSRREWELNGYSVYDEKVDGIPISQEDFVTTLGAFASAPLMCLVKTGITPTPQECEDWTALWRVIGYYFGIKQELLVSHFANWNKCKSIGASALVSMFAGEADPPPPSHFPFEIGSIADKYRVKQIAPPNPKADPYLTPATLPVLYCICNRWPAPFNFAQHCTAARHLMGETLSDWLSVPRTSLKDEIEYRVGFFFTNLPARFARIYRKGWDQKRREAMRESVEASVRFELGNRSTKFRPRAPDAFMPIKEGDEFGGVDHGSSTFGVIIDDWFLLYGEVVLLFIFVAVFWPLLVVPGLIYWTWTQFFEN